MDDDDDDDDDDDNYDDDEEEEADDDGDDDDDDDDNDDDDERIQDIQLHDQSECLRFSFQKVNCHPTFFSCLVLTQNHTF